MNRANGVTGISPRPSSRASSYASSKAKQPLFVEEAAVVNCGYCLKLLRLPAEETLCTPNGLTGLHVALDFHGLSSLLRFEFLLAGKNSGPVFSYLVQYSNIFLSQVGSLLLAADFFDFLYLFGSNN